MDKRTKILAGLFGAILGYVIIAGVIYPRWIKPQLTIDKRIAELEKEHGQLAEIEDQVEEATDAYREYVMRIGSFDIGRVETEVRDRLNQLIAKHKLQNASVSPSRPSEDRKTGLKRMTITLSAEGTVEAAVNFLKDVAALPQLARVTGPAIYPSSSSSRQPGPEIVNIRTPIELLVLPRHPKIRSLRPEEIVQPDTFVRHEDRDYALIWEKEPFTEPEPLVVASGRDINAFQGQSTTLRAAAKGGDGIYSYRWEPSDGLSNPNTASPVLNTDEPFNRTYTVMVTDDHGRTASNSVNVNIREKPAPQVPQPVVQQPTDRRWRDGRFKQIVMTLLRSAGEYRKDELMVYDARQRQNEYYAVGDEFDGGELVYVHPTGGLVHRNDEYYIYPIGGTLDQSMGLESEQVADYPELKQTADRLKTGEPAEGAKTDAQSAPASEATNGAPAIVGVKSDRDKPDGDRAQQAGADPGEPERPKPKRTPRRGRWSRGNRSGPSKTDRWKPRDPD